MNTAETGQRTVVNFMNGKCHDWRYQTYETMRGYKSEEKRTFWFGIVDLSLVEKREEHYPLSFANSYSLNLEEDSYITRDVDGRKNGTAVAEYNLSRVLEEMLKAKRYRYRYFHIPLEETVDNRGGHVVSIIAHKKRGPKTPFGIKTHKPWTEEMSKDWIRFANYELPDDKELEHFVILSHPDYLWLK